MAGILYISHWHVEYNTYNNCVWREQLRHRPKQVRKKCRGESDEKPGCSLWSDFARTFFCCRCALFSICYKHVNSVLPSKHSRKQRTNICVSVCNEWEWLLQTQFRNGKKKDLLTIEYNSGRTLLNSSTGFAFGDRHSHVPFALLCAPVKSGKHFIVVQLLVRLVLSLGRPARPHRLAHSAVLMMCFSVNTFSSGTKHYNNSCGERASDNNRPINFRSVSVTNA